MDKFIAIIKSAVTYVGSLTTVDWIVFGSIAFLFFMIGAIVF